MQVLYVKPNWHWAKRKLEQMYGETKLPVLVLAAPFAQTASYRFACNIKAELIWHLIYGIASYIIASYDTTFCRGVCIALFVFVSVYSLISLNYYEN